MNKWRSVSLAGTAAAILLATACGTQNGQGDTTNVQPAAGSSGGYSSGGYGSDGYDSGSAGAGSGGGQKAESAGQLDVREDKDLGKIVTDSAGFTLYRFDKDTAKPPKSNCDGDCAATWPAVPAADASSVKAPDPDLLGEVIRSDGTRQLTLAGWPLYRYAKDTKAGQTNGHGVGGTWYAAAPDGKKAGQPSEQPPAGEDAPPLQVVNNEKIGETVVDGKERTLYRFTKDSAWPMKIACVAECLETWKPAKPVDASKVEGIDAKLIGKTKRPDDGTEQLTIDCWPVYWFTKDTEPRDINGQGVKGTWFAVTSKGKLNKTEVASSGSGSDSGSGYSGGGGYSGSSGY